MSMNAPKRATSAVFLFADPASIFAAQAATKLAALQFQVERIDAGSRPTSEPSASVIVVEQPADLERLRARLEQSMMPVLVLTATRELAAAVLPLLEAWHDLAPVAESPGTIAWRLQRLIDLSRRSAVGLAALDPLTGLLNRNAFERQVRGTIEAPAPGEATGLLMLDLDGFKSINDRLGYAVGDRVLRSIGTLLTRRAAAGDLVARLGGDEFACLMKRWGPEEVRRDVGRLLSSIGTFAFPEMVADPSLPRLTASAGLTYLRPAIDLDRLMMEADIATYQAKANGRNRLELFGPLDDVEAQSTGDLRLRHIENVAQISAQRLVGMIKLNNRKLLEDANRKANLCAVTGLFSRQYLDARLPREINAANLQGSALSIALIDLDHFGEINRTYGWPTGDRALKALSDVVRACVRSTDWVARYAGDEFLVVMPDTALDAAAQVAERVRQAFEAKVIESFDGRHFSRTLSACVAQLSRDVESAKGFVNVASEALKGKPAGRNQIVRATRAALSVKADAEGEESVAPAEDPFNLARFVEAQSGGVYERALEELRGGRKSSHWMWFVFPQIFGLGYSARAVHYGIRGLDETRAYLAHPVLGRRLRECAQVLKALDSRHSVDDVFAYPDDLKLRSCLTLFAEVAEPLSVFVQLIDKYFGGVRDELTLAKLRRSTEAKKRWDG
jgi:diguanylate cyclase (GGDEF)-like protein